MRFNIIKYLTKEGFKNVFHNSIMTLASVSVMVCCMVLTGSAFLISANLSQVLKSVENKNSITVFLEKGVSSSKTSKIEEEIKNVPNILKCEYYSSDQASEKYKEVLGGLYGILQKGGSLFPEAFHVTMQDLSLYKQTVEKLEAIDGVDSISDRSETAKKLSDLSRLVSKTGILTVCSLGVISLFIVMNTIRLTIYDRRLEIAIMKSVGATNSFIRAPFIIEGVLIGVIAALISTGILNVAYNSFVKVLDGIINFHGVYFKNIFPKILVSFLAAGSLLGMIGSLISIRRYLKKEGAGFDK